MEKKILTKKKGCAIIQGKKHRRSINMIQLSLVFAFIYFYFYFYFINEVRVICDANNR